VTQSYKPLIIETDLKSIHDNNITIYTTNNGYSRFYNTGYTHLTNNIHNPLINISETKSLSFIDKKDLFYLIKKGSWSVDKPLILDMDLIIEEGTTLSFSSDSYLLVKGNIKLIGTNENKIILRAKDTKWKGIYVFEGKKESILNNVLIKDTDFFKDGLISLTGGVNFYKSNVLIKNTSFINSIAEDALNIVNSKFEIDNVLIDNSVSDGFDSDFSDGIINNSTFRNIKGDGVDFSGSNVKIFSSFFYNIKDKAVSSGEASTLYLENLSITDIGVGIASKDGSKTKANGLEIKNYSLNALMTYVKKSFYEQPTLDVEKLEIDKIKNAYSRQNGTEMKVNGKFIPEIDINVEKMYQTGIMKK
jgi:hypothetical protein